MTRGVLTTFSIANDVAKYFAIIPALFMGVYPRNRPAEHHASGLAAERDSVGGDLQRPNYHCSDSVGIARGPVSSARRGRASRTLFVDLWGREA